MELKVCGLSSHGVGSPMVLLGGFRISGWSHSGYSQLKKKKINSPTLPLYNLSKKLLLLFF